MRNCLIMGSGRSGTSMVAGILHRAGYFLGDKLYLPRDSNPRGFFEWKEINRINEEILSPYGRSPSSTLVKKLLKKNPVTDPGRNQRWLLSLPPKVAVNRSHPATAERIKGVVKREPFGYKDPRFSYTLPVWQPFLKPGTAFICVFREPNVTVESILKECRTRDYLEDLFITRRSAYGVWANVYSHILNNQAGRLDDFFFVHYQQIYDGSAIPYLSDFLDVELKGDFVDRDLKRTVSHRPPPPGAKKIYRKLCELAHYPPNP